MALSALAVIALASVCAAQDGPASEARLTAVEGPVSIHLHDQPEDAFVAAQEGAALEEGDVVRTGADGRAEVTLEGQSVVDVGPSSDFLVQSLRPSDTRLQLLLGSLVAKIKRLAEGENLSFVTPTAVAAVRGTELGVTQGVEGEPARVGVFDEGRVAVREASQAKEVMIGPGQETEVRRGAEPIAARPLRFLAVHRARLLRARARARFWSQHWTRRNPAERRAARARLLGHRLLRERQRPPQRKIMRRPSRRHDRFRRDQRPDRDRR